MTVLEFQDENKEEIAQGIFRFKYGALKIKFTPGGSDELDQIEVRKEDRPTFTDRGSYRKSERGRRQIVKHLVMKGFLAEDEGVTLMDELGGFFADNEELVQVTKIKPEEETQSEIEKIIENNLDPFFVFNNFERAIEILTNPNLLVNLSKWIRGFFIAPKSTIRAIIFHQASVCAPPIKRYSKFSNDSVPERGQEALIPIGISGSGKGALEKILTLFGVRVLVASRVTRSALERSAKDLLHHTTPFFPEITTIYPKDAGGEEADSQVAQVLRQAIEDNKITLIVTEKTEDGRFTQKVYGSKAGERVYPAPIITSTEEIKEVQMATRGLPVRLPDTISDFVEIGEMVSNSILLERGELENRKSEEMTALDVKLIFQAVNCLSEGKLWEAFDELKNERKEEIRRALEGKGLSFERLKPITGTELTKRQRRRLLSKWIETIIYATLGDRITLSEGVELPSGESRKSFERTDLIRLIRDGEIGIVREVLRAKGESAEKIKGMTRDLWHGFRRAQNSGLLHAFQREARIKGEGQVLLLEDNDVEIAGDLLEFLCVQRVDSGELTPRELEIVRFIQTNTDEKNMKTVKDVAKHIYTDGGGQKITDGQVRYVRKVLKDACSRNLVKRDTEEKEHKYYVDVETLGERPRTLSDYEVEGENCIKCGRLAKAHFQGAPLCQECLEEEREDV